MLCLNEFSFNIVCWEQSLNTQAKALPRPKSFGHTTTPLDGEVPLFLDHNTKQREQAAFLPVKEVLVYILPTPEDLKALPPVFIVLTEMLR